MSEYKTWSCLSWSYISLHCSIVFITLRYWHLTPVKVSHFLFDKSTDKSDCAYNYRRSCRALHFAVLKVCIVVCIDFTQLIEINTYQYITSGLSQTDGSRCITVRMSTTHDPIVCETCTGYKRWLNKVKSKAVSYVHCMTCMESMKLQTLINSRCPHVMC